MQVLVLTHGKNTGEPPINSLVLETSGKKVMYIEKDL